MPKQQDNFWQLCEEIMGRGDFVYYLLSPITIPFSFMFVLMLYFGGVEE